ncbi:HK97 gp10 family phage protein [Nostoc sp. UHCC 0870]|uniref:HK97 gp10 family phage protein n=1 Tax=Nostoc sp. UHCC 0870 TaxID=2914041 RepID=UPI001EDCE24B|nr:HK97 gp10 family phage protein [Nostoc sp. UHCC 0870]UKO99367.1 HK97 gp10 family phage protein [Nostoc sp. UHCC 0870]
MISYHIKASGPLFKNKNITKEIIQEALEETADWAQNRLRNRTPVKTGKLKAGWYVAPSKSSIRLDNPTSYSSFVEKRVGMVAKTTPEVKEQLNQILLKKTNKLK